MTQEGKELLFKDITARLSCGVKGIITYDKSNTTFTVKGIDDNVLHLSDAEDCYVEDFKPYLRPLPSMTEEERKELEKTTYYTFEYKKGERHIESKSYHRCYLFGGDGKLYGADPINIRCSSEICTKLIDWLNIHHFDYRYLIERGLALEAPEGMYNTK